MMVACKYYILMRYATKQGTELDVEREGGS